MVARRQTRQEFRIIVGLQEEKSEKKTPEKSALSKRSTQPTQAGLPAEPPSPVFTLLMVFHVPKEMDGETLKMEALDRCLEMFAEYSRNKDDLAVECTFREIGRSNDRQEKWHPAISCEVKAKATARPTFSMDYM